MSKKYPHKYLGRVFTGIVSKKYPQMYIVKGIYRDCVQEVSTQVSWTGIIGWYISLFNIHIIIYQEMSNISRNE